MREEVTNGLVDFNDGVWCRGKDLIVRTCVAQVETPSWTSCASENSVCIGHEERRGNTRTSGDVVVGDDDDDDDDEGIVVHGRA